MAGEIIETDGGKKLGILFDYVIKKEQEKRRRRTILNDPPKTKSQRPTAYTTSNYAGFTLAGLVRSKNTSVTEG
ncbi:hypothetical protein P22_3513 [Propionispora sp. 2/2-37]|nr:hypothetical protein P22_3513 [Propionispora sp. 2/2-37]